MQRRVMLLAIAALLCACLSTAVEAGSERRAGKTSRSGVYAKAIAKARETMWKAITTGKGSGVTLAMADGGKIFHAEGIGVADRAENRPVDAHTRFNVGSTSKMIVATAILLLADDGLVSLDESVSSYIPEFRMPDPRYRDITVRMLFNHTSGLPGSTFYFGYAVNGRMHGYLLETLSRTRLKHAPGAMAIYCNDGFTLAEIIVERVTGKRFVDFCRERIFEPLGMKDTGPSVGEAQERNTAEYYENAGGKKLPREVVMVYGAGGFSSTASDMCRFATSFSPFGKRILSDGAIAEALRTQPSKFADKLRGPQFCSEFGWDYSNLPDMAANGIQVLAKSGGTGYYSTYIQTVPEYGVTVVFSISGNGANLEEMSRPILDAILETRGVKAPAEKPAVKPASANPFPEGLLGFAGYYMNGNKVVRVGFNAERNACELFPVPSKKHASGKEGAPAMKLVYENGYFHDNAKNLKYYFVSDGGESYMALHEMRGYGVDVLAFQKVRIPEKPLKMAIPMEGRKWLLRNCEPDILGEGVTITVSNEFEELPGYVLFGGLRKVECADYASIANIAFRDQEDLRIFRKAGKYMVRSGLGIYSPADDAKTALEGENIVTIGHEGLNEWLRIDKGAIIGFDAPCCGRVIALTDAGTVYDSVKDSKEFYAPEGCFVFFAGRPGQKFRMTAR